MTLSLPSLIVLQSGTFVWDCTDRSTPRLVSVSFTTVESEKPFSPSAFYPLWAGKYVWVSAQIVLGVAPAVRDTCSICSEGSRSGHLSRISWCSRIKIGSPSLLKSHRVSPALSSLWGAVLFSVFRPSPVSKCGRVSLNSSTFLLERVVSVGAGLPSTPAGIPFHSAYPNSASPDS